MIFDFVHDFTIFKFGQVTGQAFQKTVDLEFCKNVHSLVCRC